MGAMIGVGLALLLFSPFSGIQNVEAQVLIDPPEKKTCSDMGLPKKNCEGIGYSNQPRRSASEINSKNYCTNQINSCMTGYVGDCVQVCKNGGTLCAPKISVTDNKQCKVDSCTPILLTESGEVVIGGTGGGGSTTILSWDCKSTGSVGLECDCNKLEINPIEV